MADPKTDLDKSLAQYLSEQSEEKRKGFTLANLFIRIESYERRLAKNERRVEALEERIEEHEERVEEAHSRLDAHRIAIVSVKRHLKQQPCAGTAEEFREQMDTGSFDLIAIQREVEEKRATAGKPSLSERVRALDAAENERKESATWWKRHAITVVTGIAAGLALMILTAILTAAVTQATRPTLPGTVQSGSK